jgi:methanethiol S-methyltransferase
MRNSPHFDRLYALVHAALFPPGGPARIAFALSFGALVHLMFASGVAAMVWAMYFGLSKGLGTLVWPYAGLANAALILQFPLIHSLLLSRRGSKVLARLVPGNHGSALSTSTYALIAGAKLLLLFVCWSPSGIIWWEAEGAFLYLITGLYALAWLLVGKATWDAGIEVQSGALGWLSVLAKRKPVFPDMPTTGLFRMIRQPIYVAFALTLWTVPVWTPDQLALASVWTAYCLLAPILKERRFQQRYGARFEEYRSAVPYALPGAKLKKEPPTPGQTPEETQVEAPKS